MQYAFTQADTGCHVDGAFGDGHLRDKLAAMLRAVAVDYPVNRSDCIARAEELESEEASDDASEVYDAVDILRGVTEPGLVWMLDGGDLILTMETEAE